MSVIENKNERERSFFYKNIILKYEEQIVVSQ
jgi:hypothetical protein